MFLGKMATWSSGMSWYIYIYYAITGRGIPVNQSIEEYQFNKPAYSNVVTIAIPVTLTLDTAVNNRLLN